MPKKILKYDCPEEESEFTWANHGHRYHSIIEELNNDLRRIQKYDDADKPEDFLKGIAYAKDKLWEIVNDHECGSDF
jgi:hypothetical protein